MKSKFLLLFVILVSLNAKAQITINTQSLIVPTDSFVVSLATSASLAKLPAFKAGGNQAWDFTTLTYEVKPGYYFFTGKKNADFSTANTTVFAEAILGPLKIPSRIYMEKTANGFTELGIANNDYKSSVTPLTGGAKDTLYVPAAALKNKDNRYVYPIKFGNTNKDIYASTRNYALTVAAFGLTKTPGQVKTSFVSTKTVPAWGNVTLPDFKNKGNKVTYAALVEVIEVKSVDSVFLAGAPAPAALLQAFGLKQGQNSGYTQIEVMVPGFRVFAIRATFDTNLKATDFEVSQEAGFVSGSVATKEAVEQLETTVFPNPSANGNFTLNFEKPSTKNWIVKIYDISGREINQHVISGNGKIAQSIDISTGKGVYFYALFNENQQFVTNGILEVQ